MLALGQKTKSFYFWTREGETGSWRIPFLEQIKKKISPSAAFYFYFIERQELSVIVHFLVPENRRYSDYLKRTVS
jgi:hypothetical protein